MIIISAGGPRAISCPGSFIIIIIRIILTHLKGWVEEQIKKVVNKKEKKEPYYTSMIFSQITWLNWKGGSGN